MIIKLQLLVLILILIICEMKIYNEKVSPLAALMLPNVILIIISEIFFKRIISLKYIAILFFISLIWFILGAILKIVFLKLKEINILTKERILAISYLSLICLFILILKTGYINGFYKIKGNMRGVLAHLYTITIPFSLVLLEKKRYKTLLIFTIIIILTGKYQIMLFIIPFLIYFIENTKKIIITLFCGISFIIMIFYLTYYINFLLRGNDLSNFNNFILGHLELYIFSPIYIGNLIAEENLRNYTEGYKITFTPFINIYNSIFGGEYVSSILNFFEIYSLKSNVAGIIGELLYNLGIKGMYIYMILLSFITYFLENIYLKNKNYIYLNYIFKSCLILSFFSNGFSNLGYIERIFGCYIILILLQKVRRVNKK